MTASPTPDATATSPTSDSATVDLSQLPAGTTVVAVDSTGQSVPLGTQQASNIIATGDPMWCPAGVAPVAGMGGCSPAIDNTQFNGGGNLLDWLSINNPSQAGVIWISSSYVASLAGDTSVTILGSTLTNMRNFSLTIKGGWTGTNAGLTDPTSPSVFNSGGLSITGWQADVTLSDIEIVNATSASAALNVLTTHSITLTRVHVHDNSTASEAGATLNNTLGSGNVTVSSSEFYNNYNDNLDVTSHGTITLTNVLAMGSTHGYGAFLNNSGAPTPMAITLSGDGLNHSFTTAYMNSVSGINNSFNNNFTGGLIVYSNGAITGSNIVASGNSTSTGSYGALLDNHTGSSNVTLSGTNVFTDNKRTGLYVVSAGTITLNNLVANSNGNTNSGYEGVTLDNTSAATAMAVSLTGSSQFKYNGAAGLDINSHGAITLNNITASYNGKMGAVGVGAAINNNYPTFASGVTLTGTNLFTNNYSNGLGITSRGAISLNNITGNYNGGAGHGAYGVSAINTFAATPQPISFTGTNSFDGNYWDGISAGSRGAVTINNLTSDNSTAGNGISVANGNAAGDSGGITFIGLTTVTGNAQDGLVVQSSFGAITINGVIATGNGQRGLDITNTQGTLGVTLAGTNNISNNQQTGLNIDTNGAVSINNLTASSNGLGGAGYGFALDNTGSTSHAGLTMTGSNVLDLNHSGGLYVVSKGPITINSLTANQNTGTGANIDNTASSSGSPQNVTFTGANVFDTNTVNGLSISTYGAIAINNLTANLNSNIGAVLHNNTALAATPKNITLTGTNSFDQNQWDNLDATSMGVISISNLTSSNSVNGYGASLSNDYAGSTGGVTLSGSSFFTSNHMIGLWINSRGAVTLNNINASSNGTGTNSDGVSVANVNGTLGVTVSGTNTFNGNGYSGLDIGSHGAISVNSTTADNNIGAYGARLDNHTSAGSPGVTLSGVNVFNQNHTSGLEITTRGAVTFAAGSSVTANNSATDAGIYLLNNYAPTLHTAVTLNGSTSVDMNVTYGMFIASAGKITLSNITATNTAVGANGTGLYAENIDSGSGSPQDVKLNGTSTFTGNTNIGLMISTYGAITVNNVTAAGNTGSYGAWLDNSGALAATPKNVTLTGANTFNSNTHSGLNISSRGLISISTITASGNGTGHVNGCGAIISNTQTGATAGVTISGAGTFDGNYDTGLSVSSYGPLTLHSITANSNGTALHSAYGASLNNQPATTGSATVTFTGTNTFDGNSLSGLQVYSNGIFTASNLHTDGNTGDGAYIDNSTSTTAAGITLTGVATFNGNGTGGSGDGLFLYSKGPIAISTTSFAATGNGVTSGYGLDAANDTAATAQPITLAGTYTLTGNYSGGLYLLSKGTITINSVNASSSVLGQGASLDNSGGTGNIVITGTNTFNANFYDGLYVTSKGTITGSNITASDNSLANTSGYGAYLSNFSASGTPGVTLTGTNVFDNNYNDGLHISTKGAISLNNVTASNNRHGFGGNLLNNTNGLGATLTGTNIFNGNFSHGLYVSSLGPISANNLTANGNGVLNTFGWGTYLDNSSATTAQAVNLTGTNTFGVLGNGNYTGGLQILSVGAITINNLTASYSTNGGGAYVTNASASGTPGVTLTGANTFSSNLLGDGMDISSNGLITVAGLNADNNNQMGVSLTNSTGGATAGVTVTGIANFDTNGNMGLYIASNGPILVSTTSLTAEDNGNLTFSAGIELDNLSAATAQPVTVSGTSVLTGSYSTNLYIQSRGAITLNNITATGSTHANGLVASNNTDGLGVTLTGTNVISGNAFGGLVLTSQGAVTLNNVTANLNGLIGSNGEGVFVDNSGSGSVTPPAVTLTGVNTFNGNFDIGWMVQSKGLISGSNVTAHNNGSYGINLSNAYIGATAGVTLTGVNDLSYNHFDGVNISSHGNVSLGKVTSDGSAVGDGFDITTTGSVTLMCGTAANNAGVGIRVTGASSLTLQGMFASGNATNISYFGPLTQTITCPLP